MLETEEEIRNCVLESLAEANPRKISYFNSMCKNEAILFNTLNNMVKNGEIEKDENFVWLP